MQAKYSLALWPQVVKALEEVTGKEYPDSAISMEDFRRTLNDYFHPRRIFAHRSTTKIHAKMSNLYLNRLYKSMATETKYAPCKIPVLCQHLAQGCLDQLDGKCQYAHSLEEVSSTLGKECRYGDECRNPKCPLVHMCRYGKRCRNKKCWCDHTKPVYTKVELLKGGRADEIKPILCGGISTLKCWNCVHDSTCAEGCVSMHTEECKQWHEEEDVFLAMSGINCPYGMQCPALYKSCCVGCKPGETGMRVKCETHDYAFALCPMYHGELDSKDKGWLHLQKTLTPMIPVELQDPIDTSSFQFTLEPEDTEDPEDTEGTEEITFVPDPTDPMFLWTQYSAMVYKAESDRMKLELNLNTMHDLCIVLMYRYDVMKATGELESIIQGIHEDIEKRNQAIANETMWKVIKEVLEDNDL